MRYSLLLLVFVALILVPGTGAAQAKRTCNDFQTQEDAQAVLDAAESGSDSTRAEIEEVYNLRALDSDGDGIACETLPRAALSQSEATVPDPTASPTLDGPDSPTAQEEAYLRALRDDAGELLSVMEELVPLFEQAGEDPAPATGPAWRNQLADAVDRWAMVSERATTHDPSSRQRHIHDIWLEVSALGLKSSDDILQGVEGSDPGVLARGGARMTYSALLLEDLTAAVMLFEDDPNAPFEPAHALHPVSGCEELPSYDAAQQYYAAYPEEQPTLDPNLDGRACETTFDGSQASPPVMPEGTSGVRPIVGLS